ncbi:MAG: hypothetical protein ACOC23_07265 [Thermodesulfobacteriota bacterium]
MTDIFPSDDLLLSNPAFDLNRPGGFPVQKTAFAVVLIFLHQTHPKKQWEPGKIVTIFTGTSEIHAGRFKNTQFSLFRSA